MMRGFVVSFRRGRRTSYRNQIIVEVPGYKTRKEASRLIGKKVVWETPGGKKLKGVITAPHGNKGRVRVRFKKGVPGQIIGERVEIL